MPKLITEEEFIQKKKDKISQINQLNKEVITLSEEFDDARNQKELNTIGQEIQNI